MEKIMSAKKKTREIEKWQRKLIALMDEVSNMTISQRQKNQYTIIEDFNRISCRLLEAIEKYFNPKKNAIEEHSNPVPETDPDEYQK